MPAASRRDKRNAAILAACRLEAGATAV